MIHNCLHQNILETSKKWNYLCKKYSFLQVGEIYHFRIWMMVTFELSLETQDYWKLWSSQRKINAENFEKLMQKIIIFFNIKLFKFVSKVIGAFS